MTSAINSELPQSESASSTASSDDNPEILAEQLRTKVLGIESSFERWGSPTVVFNVTTPSSGTEVLSYLAAHRSSGVLFLVGNSGFCRLRIDNGAIVVDKTLHNEPKLPSRIEIMLTNLCEGYLVSALWYQNVKTPATPKQDYVRHEITEWQMTYFTQVDVLKIRKSRISQF